MRIPIAYALSWPERIKVSTPRLDLAKMKTLHFSEIEDARFPALGLARAALAEGAAHCIAFNAANEVAVGRFLNGEIEFTKIATTIESILAATQNNPISSIDDIFACDRTAREAAQNL